MGNHQVKGLPKGEEEVPMVVGDPMRMRTHQIEEEDLPEGMGIQVEEEEIQTLMIVGMRIVPHPYQILHPREEESIGNLNMSMYYKDPQDHQVKRDNQDKWVEMVEMGEPCKYLQL